MDNQTFHFLIKNKQTFTTIMSDFPHKHSEQRSRPCSIIPPYVLKDIAESSHVSPESRAIAKKTLDDIPAIHEARVAALKESQPPSSGLPVENPAKEVPNQHKRD